MCATVCPSGALFFGTADQAEHQRPRSEPVNRFRFGRQEISTKVRMMVPRDRPAAVVDVTSAMDEPIGIGTDVGFVPEDVLIGAMHVDDEEGS
jgi:hypothetical protein